MSKKQPHSLVLGDRIENSILLIRGHKVLLDADLAQLYGVEIRALNRAVKRNLERFPADFMFQLTLGEWTAIRYQIGTLDSGKQTAPPGLSSQPVILKTGRGQHRKYLPYAFTEQGVAMLSSVLRSRRAVQVNIEIMRAFVRLRRVLAVNAELARRLDEVEKHVGKHDEQFVEVIRAIRHLMEPPPRPPRRRIGFQVPPDAAGDTKLSGKSQKAKRAN